MDDAALIQILRTSDEAKRVLEYDFDFRVAPIGAKSALFQLRDGMAYELVGTDTSGGEFALCDKRDLPTRPLLYASSEGQAGILARALHTGLATIIDLPYWHDCLKFSGNGQLAEMRRVVPLAESDLQEDNPEVISARKNLQRHLGISLIQDSIQELYSAITELSPNYPACGPSGWPYAPLFGKFTVMSNAVWRRRLSLQP